MSIYQIQSSLSYLGEIAHTFFLKFAQPLENEFWSFLCRSKISAKLNMCFNNSKTCENSHDKTLFTLQIARALAVFSIDEVVIFDESGKTQSNSNGGLKRHSDPNVLLARILQYLECPQYLRKNFFPKHADLQYAGM